MEDTTRPTPKPRQDSLSLIQEWATFARIVLSPGIVLLILATLGLLWILQYTPKGMSSPPLIAAALTLIISLLSALAGSLITNRWNKITETGVLVTRGKSAIRGLKLLLLNLGALESRVKVHIERLDKSEDQGNIKSLVCQNFEDVVDRCNTLGACPR